jgi:FMN phosphatase YigB (HAD superfamily)
MTDRRRLVKEADVVSFDLFDTLVVRSVARPVDAFRLAHELFNDRMPYYLTDEVAPVRFAAEVSLREEAVAAGISADAVTLDAIYRRTGDLAMLMPEMASALAEAELAAERLLLRPVAEMVDLLQFSADEGKPVLVVSDTYLSRAFVEEVLDSIGVPTGYDLWLSSERQAAKADGSLWAQIVAAYADRRILHFGDNLVGDVIHPRAFEVTAEPVTNPARAYREGSGSTQALNGDWTFRHLEIDGFRLKNVHRSLVAGLAANRLSEAGPDGGYAVGYGAFGPALLGFVQWLHRTATGHGRDHLYFLARDGQVMQRAYEAYWGEQALPATYLAASRRLLRMPAIGPDLTNQDIDFLTQTSWPMAVGDYFDRLDLPEVSAQAAALLRSMGLRPSDPGTAHGAEVRAIFWRLRSPLVAVAAEERSRLVAYWEAIGLLGARRPGVVDIGWHGSLQHAIRATLRLAGFTPDLHGFYFGLHPGRPPYAGQIAEGFVDGAKGADRGLYENLIVGSVAPLEFCFTRPEGTALFLLPDRPAATDPIEDGRGMAPASATEGWTIMQAPDQLADEDSRVLEEVQRGAVDFVTDFRQETSGMPRTVSCLERDVATESLVMLLRAPTATAAAVLGRRHHSDSFGSRANWKLIGAPQHDASCYEENPTGLAEELAETSWRPGFAVNARSVGLDVD